MHHLENMKYFLGRISSSRTVFYGKELKNLGENILEGNGDGEEMQRMNEERGFLEKMRERLLAFLLLYIRGDVKLL